MTKTKRARQSAAMKQALNAVGKSHDGLIGQK
jgi:hypothetical protein